FFQAEDGIRDFHVTGVQTCALPILDETCIRDSGCLPGGGAGSGEMEHRSGQTPLAQARRGGPVKLSAALQPGRQTQGIRPGSSWRSSISWYSPGGETALQLSM